MMRGGLVECRTMSDVVITQYFDVHLPVVKLLIGGTLQSPAKIKFGAFKP